MGAVDNYLFVLRLMDLTSKKHSTDKVLLNLDEIHDITC